MAKSKIDAKIKQNYYVSDIRICANCLNYYKNNEDFNIRNSGNKCTIGNFATEPRCTCDCFAITEQRKQELIKKKKFYQIEKRNT